MKKEIEELKAKIKAKQAEIDNFEIDPDDYENEYCEMLNEEGPVKVAGLTFEADQIIRKLDPTAYRCGLVDYVDGIEKSDVKEYQELEEELAALEDELTDLENELEKKEDKAS